MQMWNDLKNENRQNIYAPQSVKSHCLQAVNSGHFFRPTENDAINVNKLFGTVE